MVAEGSGGAGLPHPNQEKLGSSKGKLSPEEEASVLAVAGELEGPFPPPTLLCAAAAFLRSVAPLFARESARASVRFRCEVAAAASRDTSD
mmetsp:Transcript_62756/g.139732  ORF Transcript_62756/g.139732 Transcript_62756/m.139732 type:complete len:91 (-) Transcript_62756:1624-1896(-)